MSETATGRTIEIVVPAVPHQRANPNFKNSERNRKVYRKAWAVQAVMPVRDLRINGDMRFPITGPVILDILIRWPNGRNTYGDRQNVITMAKELVDVLQKEGIIVNDRYLSIGAVEQERAIGQEETILTLREDAS